jgi:flagellar motility protein MotE (MotC chaperone)
MIEIKRKLSSLMHTMLPMLAPFFLQAASASFLMKVLPLPAALGSALGLIISYLFGPIGFFISAASWGTFLAIEHPELLKDNVSLLFLSSCVVSWWLATLCAEQYQQKVVDFEEMIASLFKKNTDLEKQSKDVLHNLKEERKESERQITDLNAQMQDLQNQLSSHRHHLSLAWQESSMLKEEAEKQKKQLLSSYESAQSQAMFYLQQKQMIEASYDLTKTELEKLKVEKEEKQNQFLEEFRSLQAKIEEASKERAEKESELLSLQEKIRCLEEEKVSQPEPVVVASEISADSEEKAIYWETLYKQLRTQFDEKSQVLNETRKELFTVENQLLTSKKQEEDTLQGENEEQTILISDLKELENECQDLEEQVLFLEDIISSFQEKKKVVRLKKTKKSEDAAEAIEKLLETRQQTEENLFIL